MTALADAVLPLIRTRADLWRWSAANEHGRQMHEAVDILDEAAQREDPAAVLAVTEKAIASAYKVILRADDSSGIIGDAVRRLLDLHPLVAARARPRADRLVAWMEKMQFAEQVDYFSLDPVAYAPALGEEGMDLYRRRLDAIAEKLSPEQSSEERWNDPDSGVRHTLEWNAQRLAVLDRDVEAVIRTHLRDGKVAAWVQDVAEALEEIGELDLAIEWAERATRFDRGHQAKRAGEYWCGLLAAHRPSELLAARLEVFRTWPTSDTAARLHETAGQEWPTRREEVLERLSARPRDAVLFALQSLKEVGLAWELAHSLELHDADTWSRVVKEYEKLDPLGSLPIHRDLVEQNLEVADARGYHLAARRLKRMRALAKGTQAEREVEAFVAELREVHRRRPRLQLELDRAGLP